MKHFIVGPVELFDSTKSVLKDGYTYFRTEEYGSIVKSCLNKLSNLLGNNTENSLVYFAASGTGAMEAVIDNCVNKEDKALVLNGGSFGNRFCEMLKWHNFAYDEIKLNWNEVLKQSDLEPFEKKDYTIFFVNHDETSSGKLYDMQLISDFCKRNNLLLVVDAISSFLSDEYDMEKYGIDATIISSQKGLCLSPGMSFISLSQRMKQKVLSSQNPTSYYFDLKKYFLNIERGQTPFTPTVFIMYELRDMLDKIDKVGGKEVWIENIKKKATYFREKAENIGFCIPNYTLSNTLTPLIFDDVDASEIVKKLRDKYEIYVNPCGGELSKKMLRVAHIGDVNFEDIDDLISKMFEVYNELKSDRGNL